MGMSLSKLQELVMDRALNGLAVFLTFFNLSLNLAIRSMYNSNAYFEIKQIKGIAVIEKRRDLN